MAYHSLRKRAFWATAWAALLAVLFVTWQIIYWQVQSYELPYIQEPIKILNENKTIKIGEPIRMEIRYIKLHPTESINSSPTIQCESGNLVTMVGREVDLPLGQRTLISDSYILPPKILDGDVCRFVFQTTFRINPIKTAQEDWYSEEFTVINKGAHNE